MENTVVDELACPTQSGTRAISLPELTVIQSVIYHCQDFYRLQIVRLREMRFPMFMRFMPFIIVTIKSLVVEALALHIETSSPQGPTLSKPVLKTANCVLSKPPSLMLRIYRLQPRQKVPQSDS
jgi:hypothetical protein